MGYDWDFAPFLLSAPAFGRAFLRTIEIAASASVCGTVSGALLGAVLAGHGTKKAAVGGVLGAARAVPLLVLIFFFYYFPYRELGVAPPSALAASVLALSLAQCAHSFEMISAGLSHVPYEHKLGLRALGFDSLEVTRHAVLPWVVRETLPGHMTLWIGNILQSSLASTIGVEETVYVAKLVAAQSFRSLEAWSVVAVLYLLLVIPLNAFQRRIEVRYRQYRREGV